MAFLKAAIGCVARRERRVRDWHVPEGRVRLRHSQSPKTMRRIVTWVGLVAFAVALIAAAAPYRGLAQPAQAPADTPAKFEPGRLGVETMALSEQSIKAL